MSFDTRWLDLREPADHAARDSALMAGFAGALSSVAAPDIVDLGCGTGSTLRAFRGVLPQARWTLADHDPALLAEAKRRHPEAVTIEADLAAGIETLLEGRFDAVTASALFDLVSEEWIARFVAALGGRPLHAALSYDGLEQWSPEHPTDDDIERAFQAHQRRDKGFGLSLGPLGVSRLASALEGEGYRVQLAPSPWRLSRETQGNLMDALAEGTAKAAIEAGCARDTAAEWFRVRQMSQSCRIGHIDLLAVR